jgi:cytochrome P450
MVCPDDIASDPAHIACIGSLLSVVTQDASALSFVFPWISVIKQIKTIYHGQKLWRTLKSAIKRREGQAIDDTDCISFMMEKGDSVEQMISVSAVLIVTKLLNIKDGCTQFIIGAVVLGLLNTTRLQAWLLIYFNIYPEWKAKVIREMDDFVASHGATPECMQDIPFQAWETALPTLEACISELIRVLGDAALLRQNYGGDFDIGGRTIPANSFLAYPMSDVHHDPSFYPNPMEFDPTRVPHKDPHFVGWGSG